MGLTNTYNPANDPGYQNQLAYLAAGQAPNISSNLSDIGATQSALQRYQALLAQQTSKYGSDTQLKEAQANAAAQQYASDQSRIASQQSSQLQYNLGQNTLAQSQKRYDQLFPMISGLYNTAQGQGGGYGGAAPPAPSLFGGGAGGSGAPSGGGYGGSVASLPSAPSYGGAGAEGAPSAGAGTVSGAPAVGSYSRFASPTAYAQPGAHPVLSEGQVNQQVNQQQAQNQAASAGQQRRATEGAGGRGVGSNSPLAQAMRAQIQGQTLGANTAASTQTRLDAAKLNAANQQAYDLANQQSATALGAAQMGAQASEFGSAQGAQASMYGSNVGAQAQQNAAAQAAQASMFASSAAASASRQNAINAALASNYNAQLGYGASTYGSGLDYQAQLASVQAQRQNSILAALAGLAG